MQASNQLNLILMPNARAAAWCITVSKAFAAASALFVLLAVGAGVLASVGYVRMWRQSAATADTIQQQAVAAKLASFNSEIDAPARDADAIRAAGQRIMAARNGSAGSAYVGDEPGDETDSWNWNPGSGESKYAEPARNTAFSSAEGEVPRIMPAGNGAITSPFGFRIHPISGIGQYHQGMDIDGVTGDAIRAAAGGTVVNAEWHGGYGLLVAIDHGNGFATRYGHLSSIGVQKGQRVAAGQVIARMGSTGYSTGSHLHYEVRYRGSAVDPWQFYGRDALQ